MPVAFFRFAAVRGSFGSAVTTESVRRFASTRESQTSGSRLAPV